VVAKKGIPLVVDSAHGSHWVFCNEFPMRAETAGAQIVTYSTHKTCTVLGQGSLMIVNDKAIVPRLYEIANSCGFVSTSFSYVILSALFYGIGLLAEDGGRQFSENIALANWARAEISKIDGLRSFGIEDAQSGFVDFDPLRLTVDVSGIGYTGYEVEDILIEQYGFYPEMGTLQNVLFLITTGIGREDVELLVERFRRIAANPKPAKLIPKIQKPELPIQAYIPRDAFYFTKRRDVPVYESIGCVSAETISAYPPGSAVIVAGEIITREVVEYLNLIRQFGGHLKGAGDTSFQKIKTLDI
jgi:arginine/lysine/ornithine decarboxylase